MALTARGLREAGSSYPAIQDLAGAPLPHVKKYPKGWFTSGWKPFIVSAEDVLTSAKCTDLTLASRASDSAAGGGRRALRLSMQTQSFLPESERMFTVFGAVGIIVFLLVLGVGVAIMAFLQRCLATVPPEHRRMASPLVWLLLIPCFNIFWSFFVFLKVSQSFRAYFEAESVSEVGDCGQATVLAYCAFACLSLFGALMPWLGLLFAAGALFMLAITLLRFQSLKQRITSEAK